MLWTDIIGKFGKGRKENRFLKFKNCDKLEKTKRKTKKNL